MLVYLFAASLPPSEGNRHSSALGATGKMNKSCLIQENKSASRYLCWLHLYVHSKFLMWTTGASERIVCIKLEIRDLGIKGRLGVPSCWAHWADVAFPLQNQIHSTLHISFVLERMWALQGPIFVESLCRFDECLKWFLSLKQPQKHSAAQQLLASLYPALLHTPFYWKITRALY